MGIDVIVTPRYVVVVGRLAWPWPASPRMPGIKRRMRLASWPPIPSGGPGSASAAPWNASASPRPLTPARLAASGVVGWLLRWETTDWPLTYTRASRSDGTLARVAL